MAKTQVSTNLESLNKVLPNLTANKSTTKRRVTDGNKNDVIADELAKCNSAAEIAALGMKFGLSEQDVRNRCKTAKNFGLYRMQVGNLIRGIVARIRKAAKKNVKLTPAEAAYPKKAKAIVAAKTQAKKSA